LPDHLLEISSIINGFLYNKPYQTTLNEMDVMVKHTSRGLLISKGNIRIDNSHKTTFTFSHKSLILSRNFIKLMIKIISTDNNTDIQYDIIKGTKGIFHIVFG